MTIAFTSWTAATWDGAAYTLDWSHLQHRLLTGYCAALSDAVAERCAAVGYTPGAAAAYGRSNRVPTVDWAHAIHEAISACIVRYVNHTDNSGAWDALQTCAPYWTEATLLAHLGETREPHPEKNEVPTSAWVKQCKRLVDHLLWTRRTRWMFGGFVPSPEAADTYDIGITTSLTAQAGEIAAKASAYATLVAAVDDAVARVASGTYPNYIGAETYASVSADATQYWGTAGHCWGKVQATGIYSSLAHAAQYYLWTEAAGTYAETSRTFDDEGRGYTQTAWNDIEELAAAALATRTSNEFGTAGAGWPPVYPPDAGASSVNWRGWAVYGCRIVFKWNVSGGFKFV